MCVCVYVCVCMCVCLQVCNFMKETDWEDTEAIKSIKLLESWNMRRKKSEKNGETEKEEPKDRTPKIIFKKFTFIIPRVLNTKYYVVIPNSFYQWQSLRW